MASTHKKLPWIEWLCHSNFSFLTGASHPEEYIQRAYDLQYRGIGITDFDGLYGIVRAFNARRELLKDDCDYVPQIFYGCEIHMDQDHSSPVVLRKTLVLFALNKKGYSQICKIISYAHRNSKNEAYITLDELAQCSSDHLVCLQPMRGMIRYQTLVKTEAHYRQLQEIFQDRFYLVVSRHLSPSEDLWIGPTIDLAKQIGIPLLMSQDAFFHQASEKITASIKQVEQSSIELTKAATAVSKTIKDIQGITEFFKGDPNKPKEPKDPNKPSFLLQVEHSANALHKTAQELNTAIAQIQKTINNNNFSKELEVVDQISKQAIDTTRQEAEVLVDYIFKKALIFVAITFTLCLILILIKKRKKVKVA